MTKMEMTTADKIDKIYELLNGFSNDEAKTIMDKILYKRYNISAKSLVYYHKNREDILQKRKERLQNEEEKLRLKQVRAEWYAKNKEHIKERNKNYYQQKKMEKMAEKANKAVEV